MSNTLIPDLLPKTQMAFNMQYVYLYVYLECNGFEYKSAISYLSFKMSFRVLSVVSNCFTKACDKGYENINCVTQQPMYNSAGSTITSPLSNNQFLQVLHKIIHLGIITYIKQCHHSNVLWFSLHTSRAYLFHSLHIAPLLQVHFLMQNEREEEVNWPLCFHCGWWTPSAVWAWAAGAPGRPPGRPGAGGWPAATPPCEPCLCLRGNTHKHTLAGILCTRLPSTHFNIKIAHLLDYVLRATPVWVAGAFMLGLNVIGQNLHNKASCTIAKFTCQKQSGLFVLLWVTILCWIRFWTN